MPLLNVYLITLMSALVYLLKHHSQPRVKIGNTTDLRGRVGTLGVNRFDFSQSEVLLVEDKRAAENLERLLHRAFTKFHIEPRDLVLVDGESREGDTEWFHLRCKEPLSRFLELNQELLGHELVGSAELAAFLSPEAARASRVVRVTVSMPKADSAIIPEIMRRVALEGHFCTRSEIVRIGLMALSEMSLEEFMAVVNGLEKVAPGRKKAA